MEEDAPRTSREHSPPESRPQQLSLEDAVRENEGLKHAIDIFEDDTSVLEGSPVVEDDMDATTLRSEMHEEEYHSQQRESQERQPEERHSPQDQQQHDQVSAKADDYDEPAGAEDTMISNFSDFSIMPNATMLANLHSANPSPSKFATYSGLTTPRAPPVSRSNDPSQTPMRTPRANGPLPNRAAQYESGNTTNLLDFTENLRLGPYQLQQQPSSPSRSGGRTSPFKNGATMPAQTPQRNGNLVNLLDFDLPPMPTPRSVPSITPRELESLKSGFLSEISSLKASLSGKEAEVLSLKTAVGDAEGRVGTCMEQLRDLQSQMESLTTEKDSWEKRGREMEAVLRQVKEEIVHGRREREELEARLDEAEKRRDAAETMAQEAESKMAGMRAGKASAEAALATAGTPIKSPIFAGTNKEVEMAVEKVARELHALYKGKHETKVAALKTSYEQRWHKKVGDLENKVEELTRENEELRIGRDATMTRVDFAAASRMREELEEERKADRRRHAELEAEVEKLEAVVRTVRKDNEEIRAELERERIEKGELVQLAEEMMNMQAQQSFMAAENNNSQSNNNTTNNTNNNNFGSSISAGRHSQPNPPQTVIRPQMVRPQSTGSATPGAAVGRIPGTPSKALAGRIPASPSGGELGWKSSHGPVGIARPTGLRAPGTASRIGKGVGGTHGRNGSTVSSGVPRPGSGLGMARPTGLMSSIEKMGSYRG